jgi:hypothetical protein
VKRNARSRAPKLSLRSPLRNNKRSCFRFSASGYVSPTIGNRPIGEFGSLGYSPNAMDPNHQTIDIGKHLSDKYDEH